MFSMPMVCQPTSNICFTVIPSNDNRIWSYTLTSWLNSFYSYQRKVVLFLCINLGYLRGYVKRLWRNLGIKRLYRIWLKKKHRILQLESPFTAAGIFKKVINWRIAICYSFCNCWRAHNSSRIWLIIQFSSQIAL